MTDKSIQLCNEKDRPLQAYTVSTRAFSDVVNALTTGRGVTARRDRVWLSRFIATPDQLLAEKDPLATALFAQYQNVQMPNLRLGEADVAVLLNYLEQQGTAQPRPAGTQAVGAQEHQHLDPGAMK